MQPRMDSNVGLAAAGRAHKQRQLALDEGEVHALERLHLARALAELLDDVFCFENRNRHLVNTVAGSIFVTLMIAEIADTADMKSVRPKSAPASPGVMTSGSGVLRLM